MVFGIIAAVIAVVASAGVYYQQKKMEAQARKQANEAKAVQVSGHDSNRGLYTVYGEALVGSTIVWKKVTDKEAKITQTGFTTLSAASGTSLTTNKDHKNNRWLYRAVTLCNGPVTQVTNVTIDDEGYNSPRFTNRTTKHFATSISLGPEAGQNFSALRTAYSSTFGTWGSNATGKGVAYAMERLFLDKDKPAFQGEPQTKYKVKGRKLYDPRKDSTSSVYDSSLGTSSHREDTASTWEWSDNPVLALLDYMRSEEYGRGLPLSVIDLASIATAADKCDVLVDVPQVLTNDTGSTVTYYDPETGEEYTTTINAAYPYYRANQTTTGTYANKQKRFRINIAIDPSKEILDNIQEILNVFRGNLSYANGKYLVHMADVQSSVLSLDDDDIIGGLKIANGDRSQRMNRATVKFINENKQHKTDQVSWPSLDSNEDGGLYDTYLAEDEDEKLHRTFTVKGCTDYYQAQDTAEFLVRESRSNLTVSGTFGSRCFGLVPGDVVSLDYDSAGFSGKYFRVIQSSIDLVSMNVQLQLKEYDSSVYTWNTNRGNEPLGLSWQEEVVNAAPTNLTIGTIATNTRTRADGSTAITLTIPFSDVPEGAQYVEVSWAINGTNDYNTQIVFDTENQTQTEVAVERDGETYAIRARYFATNSYGTLMPSDYATTTHAVADLSGTKLDGIEDGATQNTGALADLDTVDTDQIDNDAVTIAKLDTSLQSTNYSAGVSGWKLTKAGDFEAGDGTFRGSISATSLTLDSGITITSSNLPSDAVYDADLDATKDYLLENTTGENLVTYAKFDDTLEKGPWTGSVVQMSSEATNTHSLTSGSAAYTRLVTENFYYALAISSRDSLEGVIKVEGGETLYFSCWVNAEYVNHEVNFGYRKVIDGSAQSSWTSAASVASGTQGWQFISGALEIASDATAIYPWLQIDGYSNYGVAYVTELRISRSPQNKIGGTFIKSNKLYNGTTDTFNTSTTNFYLDSSGQFSLQDKLSFDGTTLSVSGDVVADAFTLSSGATLTDDDDQIKNTNNNAFFRYETTAANDDVSVPNNTAFSSAFGRNPRTRDILVVVNTTSNPDVSAAYIYNGSSWDAKNDFFTGDVIVDGTITADHLSVNSLDAISADLGSITSGSLNIGSGNFTVASDGTMTATGATITGGSVSNSTTVGGTAASTVASGAAAGATAVQDDTMFSAKIAWGFDEDAQGFVVSGTGASITHNSDGYIVLDSTSNDPILYTPTIALDGGKDFIVRARIKRTSPSSGATWQGTLYYRTSGHSDSESYKKTISDPTVLNEWVVAEWDMSNLTAGGTDWVDNTITRLRFDFGNTANDDFQVDWVAVGTVGSAALREGADVQSGSVGGISIEPSKLYAGTGTWQNANTGFYLDDSGKFSLKDKLFFNPTNDTLTVDGSITADVITAKQNLVVLGDLEASSVAAGSITRAMLSQDALDEIFGSLATSVGGSNGDFKEGSGSFTTSGGSVTLGTSSDKFDHGSSSVEVEFNINTYFYSTTNYTQAQAQATLTFEATADGTFNDLNSADKTHTLQFLEYDLSSYYGTTYLVYYLNTAITKTFTSGSGNDLADNTDVQFRVAVSGVGSAFTGQTISFEASANEGVTGVTSTGGNADTLDNLDSTAFLRSNVDDTFDGTLTITGDLILQGGIDQYNVTNLDVTDKTITVNNGGTQTLSDGAGLIIDRGTATDASLTWNETTDLFDFNNGIEPPFVYLEDQNGTVSSLFAIYAWDDELQFTKRNLSTRAWEETLLALDYSTEEATFSGAITGGGTITTSGNLVAATGHLQSYGAYFSHHLRVLNNGGTGWNTWATRNNGNFDLSVGSISSGAITTTGNLNLSGNGLTSDNNTKFYVWRAMDNTSSQNPNYRKIARITGTQSSRFMITLTGSSNSYGDGTKGSKTEIYGQLNNDNNYDITATNYDFSATTAAVTEVGFIDVGSYSVDIYVKVASFSELAAYGVISDGSITPDTSSSSTTTEPSNYTAASFNTVWTDQSFTSTNVTNWNTAYTYSQVGHVPLGGGTMTGALAGPYFKATSNIPTETASAGYLDYVSGGTRIVTKGADASTLGKFTILQQASDASPATQALEFDTASTARFAGAVLVGATSGDADGQLHVQADTTSTVFISAKKTYGSGTGTNERARLILSINENSTSLSAADRPFFSLETRPDGETTSAASNTELKVRSGGALTTSVEFKYNVTDFKLPITLSANSYLSLGNQTLYIGRNSFQSLNAASNGYDTVFNNNSGAPYFNAIGGYQLSGLNVIDSSRNFVLNAGAVVSQAERTVWNTAATGTYYLKIADRGASAGLAEYMHFFLRAQNYSEHSIEVKIHIPAYAGFSSSYGDTDNGQGIQVEINHGGLNSQTNAFHSIIECANLSNTSDQTEIWLRIQPPDNSTVIYCRDAGDANKPFPVGTSGWTTTAPSNQAKVFSVINGANNINGTQYQYRNRTYFPTLDLSISNANSSHSSGNYLRGNSTHLVVGTGGTLYLNYGNTSGTTHHYGHLNLNTNGRITFGDNQTADQYDITIGSQTRSRAMSFYPYFTLGTRYSAWDGWIGANTRPEIGTQSSGVELATSYINSGAAGLNVQFGALKWYHWTAAELSGLSASSGLTLGTPKFEVNADGRMYAAGGILLDSGKSIIMGGDDTYTSSIKYTDNGNGDHFISIFTEHNNVNNETLKIHANTKASTFSGTLASKDLTITSGGDGNTGLQINRASGNGRAQFSLNDENGGQLWRVGLTGPGSSDFAFFDGAANVLTLYKATDVAAFSGGATFGAGVEVNGKLVVDVGTLPSTSGGAVDHVEIDGTRHHIDIREMRTANGSDWNNTTMRIQNRVDSTRFSAIDFVADGSYQRHIDIMPGSGTTTTLTRFHHNGRVGIGSTWATTAPSYLLDVAGDIRLSGHLYLESGTGGTTNKLTFKTSDNTDLNKFIRTSGYYLELGGHANEGFKFTDTNSNTLLALYGGNNALAKQAVFAGEVIQNGNAKMTKVFAVPQTGSASKWIKIGNFTTSQDGRSVLLTIVTNQGYNASDAQNSVTTWRFKTSNASSNQSGFYGDAQVYQYGLNANPSSFKIVQNSTSSYDFWVNFPNYTGHGSFVTVSHHGGTWTNSMATQTTDPGGTSFNVKHFATIDHDGVMRELDTNLILPTDKRLISSANSTWGDSIAFGGNGHNVGTNQASVATTNGNLHLDAATGNATYINWYGGTAGFYVGNGAGAAVLQQTAAGALTVSNNITAYGSPSDITLKENIEVIPDPLEKVQKLRGVTFNYKKDGSRSTGLIAQELQEVLPEVVYTFEDLDDKSEHLAVRYGNVAGLLVESVKALKKENDELRAMLVQLMEKLNDD
jgi:hypothetical protein